MFPSRVFRDLPYKRVLRGLGFRTESLDFRVSGLGCGAQGFEGLGLGFRVSGLGGLLKICKSFSVLYGGLGKFKWSSQSQSQSQQRRRH